MRSTPLIAALSALAVLAFAPAAKADLSACQKFAVLSDRAVIADPRSALEALLGDSLSTISLENLARERSTLGEMTQREKAILKRQREIEPSFVIRLNAGKLSNILDNGAFFSVGDYIRRVGKTVATKTPFVEHALYFGFEYVFGTIAYTKGNPRYGDIVLHIRPNYWKAKAWASEHSGINALKTTKQELGGELNDDFASPALMAVARRTFAKQIYTPPHMRDALAVQTIKHLRANPALRLDDVLRDFTRLEGHIDGPMPLSAIESAEMPASLVEELGGRLRSLGIRVTVSEEAQP